MPLFHTKQTQTARHAHHGRVHSSWVRDTDAWQNKLNADAAQRMFWLLLMLSDHAFGTLILCCCFNCSAINTPVFDVIRLNFDLLSAYLKFGPKNGKNYLNIAQFSCKTLILNKSSIYHENSCLCMKALLGPWLCTRTRNSLPKVSGSQISTNSKIKTHAHCAEIANSGLYCAGISEN